MAEGGWTLCAVAATTPSSAVASGLVAGGGTVYTDGRWIVVEGVGTKAAIAPGSRRSRPLMAPPLALSWVAQLRQAFPHRDEGNLRLDRCARGLADRCCRYKFRDLESREVGVHDSGYCGGRWRRTT